MPPAAAAHKSPSANSLTPLPPDVQHNSPNTHLHRLPRDALPRKVHDEPPLLLDERLTPLLVGQEVLQVAAPMGSERD